MRRIAWLTSLLAALVASCRTPGRAPASDLDPPSVFRFPHDERAHAQLLCAACHAEAAEDPAGAMARPGAKDHAPCDRSGCHAQDFTRAPGRLCTLCHEGVRPWEDGATRAAPWPPEAGPRARASEFSHARHLDKRALDERVGFHVSCDDCHAREPSGPERARPRHAACARCHGAGTAGRLGVPPRMDSCEACHRLRDRDPPRGRSLLGGRLRFPHDRHEEDREGRALSCNLCHADITGQKEMARMSVPPTQVCVACHESAEAVPQEARMSRCAICHGDEGFGFASLTPPRSHLLPRARPDDHTLAFRRDHATQATRAAPTCARCHTQVSGTSRDGCDQCHQSMRPRDHSILWREFDHGPEAATTSERCATCHVGDFCVACHSRPPRNHFPRATFRERDHALAARFDARACLTCHDPQRDCAGCHR